MGNGAPKGQQKTFALRLKTSWTLLAPEKEKKEDLRKVEDGEVIQLVNIRNCLKLSIEML